MSIRHSYLTVGILNKIDHDEAPHEAPTMELVCGTGNESVRTNPEHGWHPLRMRNAYEATLAPEVWLQNQREEFASGSLRVLAELCGRGLGWEPTSELIYGLYEGVVVAK